MAQENDWRGPSSGSWQSPDWSLGILPGANQNIVFTNAGVNLLTIDAATAQNYPQTLNIESLAVSAPYGSTNELLMDAAGLETPLVIGITNEGILSIASGTSIFEMHSSALEVNGGINVSGTFNESDGSEVSAESLGVNGEFNLTNSTLNVAGIETVGQFNQTGGTNTTGGLVLDAVAYPNSQYNMSDGYFAGAITLDYGSFIQTGGQVFASVNFQQYGGKFQFAGGVISQNGLNVQGNPGGPYMQYATSVVFKQTNGTIYSGDLNVGMSGYGEFTQSGGLLVSSNLNVGVPEEFEWENTPGAPTFFLQSGGVHSNYTITLTGAPLQLVNTPSASTSRIIVDPNSGKLYGVSTYTFSGGMLYSSAINLSYANFNQTGGTNEVGTISGDSYSLSGGKLIVQNLMETAG
ncbi:MAG TPA: hypothetical protein VG754_04155, partial [Verrucomicrobiae bacterium]|nr:hypothetical protein [Verrucomicrobiae bacterium]